MFVMLVVSELARVHSNRDLVLIHLVVSLAFDATLVVWANSCLKRYLRLAACHPDASTTRALRREWLEQQRVKALHDLEPGGGSPS